MDLSLDRILNDDNDDVNSCATSRKVAGLILDGVIGIFLLTQSLRTRYGPRVDSDSNRNVYQGYFLGVKAAGA